MKVGIITQYYHSNNYGGNLQAYALCRFLDKNGYDAEQICCDVKLRHITILKNELSFFDKLKDFEHVRAVLKIRTIGKFDRKIRYKNQYADMGVRINKVLDFNRSQIPHSKKIYTEGSIGEAVNAYDCFITGSDIVWYPRNTSPTYMLGFVDEGIPKFSYAASLSVNTLTNEEKSAYKKYLKSYQGISVREKSAVDLLQDVSPVEIKCVLDPTLILDKEEWDKICSKRLIDDKYLFCYFLGKNKKSRQTAESYAKKHGLKIVTLPYLSNSYNKYDDKFGDMKLFSVSPSDFISLIKYSDCVFTDSFHCCVFSYIYNREVFAFKRGVKEKLGVRVKSFLDTVNLSTHYCGLDDRENVDYIECQEPAEKLYDSEKMNELKKESISYLIENLNKAQKAINNKS